MLLITIKSSNAFNAGPKAIADVTYFLKEKYKDTLSEKIINVPEDSFNGKKSLKKIIKKIINNIKKIIAFLVLNLNKDLKIVQYPVAKYFFIINLIPKKNSIGIIHDLIGLREQNFKKQKKEIKILSKFRVIIAHNNKMKKYLVENGINQEKIEVLELFDYKVNEDRKMLREKIEDKLSIDYVGNLTEAKCPFIYGLKESNMKFNINLYGQGFVKNEKQNSMIKYCGAFPPDELPSKLKGNFGLVWDGKLNEADEKNPFKNYTKYNNPHKLSCYIAAGNPVIVWEKAAVAELVRKYDIGYTINNLYEINELDFTDYEVKRKNVMELSEKVKRGYFTEKVFDKIINEINNKTLKR